VTNDLDLNLTAGVVRERNAVRWWVEQLHREMKQVLGSEACQCRKGRSQRNHWGLVLMAWVSLAVHARGLFRSVCVAERELWRDYLVAELVAPRVRALSPG
jgi:hypothetical protein